MRPSLDVAVVTVAPRCVAAAARPMPTVAASRTAITSTCLHGALLRVKRVGRRALSARRPCRRQRGGNCEFGTGSARFAVGALSVKPITAQLMSTPTEPYGAGWPGRRVDACEQVGPGRGEVEHLHLVDLARVETGLDGLVRPEPELRVPQRAVGVRVARVLLGREVTEHVQKVTAVAERVDQRRVGRTCVLGGVTVLDQVNEALRLRVVAPVWPLMKPNRRSRAEPRKSSPPWYGALSSAGA